jgi:DeoR/GlpR family transcriptional regulator of sugar metabolism
MLQEERHNFILQQIITYNKVVVSELCSQLNVSLDTIRRDIKELERKGKVLKVHGGAISPLYNQPFQQPVVYAQEEKKRVAEKAVTLMKDGMTLLAGGGTVMLEVARLLPEQLKGTFFTVSPLVALEAAQRSTVEVILIGGRLARNTYICTGAGVATEIMGLQVDLCLLGTNGISIEAGITDYDWEVAAVKKAILTCATKCAVLSISEKLGTEQKVQVAKLKAIDYLVTELEPTDERLKRYNQFLTII